ncbi:ADP-ribosylglycohydrolase family protein [Streptomonospora litoralis]|uniref:ADP-ribosyl-[dinitrogen reductase] glycohydrolase n=1 Tax=Streptomonospora litoralis TaxID=2498135 RepID=A0A4P6Q600_9ACTN|nr:ADP-ribosylglycohydrolase family protein [Streptomonospora litoralis]QBI54449.1 ADP-ribosyl-[dinitrogen reductase] glycohydrolase [Streptomonospora litoralis]
MHLSALLDFDVVPVDTEDHVTVLLDVTAPHQQAETERAPATLQVVLDRSGSMRGSKLQGAVTALLSLIDRLDPTDKFGLVTFDSQARVEVPAGPLHDKESVRRRISGLRPGGSTDLSSGLLRGIQEARRASADSGATLLLVSDGHANVGITEHAALADCARTGYAAGVATTTLGYGLGFDEELLGAIADGGAGSALFAEDPDTAAAQIAREAEYLLSKTAQAASLRVKPDTSCVKEVAVVGELPSTALDDGSVMIDLGDFYSGERRRLLLRLGVPGIPSLGLATVAELVATYVDPASLSTCTATLPVSVNVVPGDAAAGRVPAPAVETERAFQHVQTAKRQASEALRRGEREQASRGLAEARRRLADQLTAARSEQSDELRAQLAELDRLARRARTDDANHVSKAAFASQAGYTKSRARMAADTARHLRDADRDAAAPDSSRGHRGPAAQHAGTHTSDPAADARARDALEGLSVGDAFGERFFAPGAPDPGADTLPAAPWHWTDDTEMACGIVDVLARLGRIDQDELARVFAARWDAERGYGRGTRGLLTSIGAGTPWRAAAAAQFGGAGSLGNGAAMRAAPLGAYFGGEPDRARTEAALSAEVTHAHPAGVAGAVAVALAASAASADPDLGGADLLDAARAGIGDGPVRSGLERAAALLGAPAEEAARELGNGARVSAADTVPFALWAAAAHPGDFTAAVRACARAGGDMDTTAAIAGGVAASRGGIAGVPADWRAAREPLPKWIAPPPRRG